MDSSQITQIILGVLTLITVIGSSYISYLSKKHSKEAAKHSKEINDAVNHTHEKGTPRIYDLAVRNTEALDRIEPKVNSLEDWRKGYEDSPWKDGKGVKAWLKENGHSNKKQ